MDNPNGPANLWVVPDRASEFLYWGMREQTKLPRMSIGSTEDLLGIIPVVLGFHPSESLVLLVVSDGELQVAARCDLTDVTIPGGAAELVGRLWFQYPDADALAVAYSSSSQLAWDALAEVSGVLPDAATVIRLHVTPDRYFTGPGSRGYAYRLRVPEGESGLPVLPDRTDIAAMLLPRYPDDELRRAASAVSGMDAQVAAEQAERHLSTGELDAPAAAVVGQACTEPGFVEGIIGSICRSNAQDMVDLWGRVVSGVDPALSGAPLGVLAIAAWVAGDGALTNVCLERALADGYWDAWLDLANLVIMGAVHPRVWDDLRAAYLEDVGFGS